MWPITKQMICGIAQPCKSRMTSQYILDQSSLGNTALQVHGVVIGKLMIMFNLFFFGFLFLVFGIFLMFRQLIYAKPRLSTDRN